MLYGLSYHDTSLANTRFMKIDADSTTPIGYQFTANTRVLRERNDVLRMLRVEKGWGS